MVGWDDRPVAWNTTQLSPLARLRDPAARLASIDRDGWDDDELGFIARFTDGSVGASIATISFPCPEDLDGSGIVDFGSLLMVPALWGPCTLPRPADDCGGAPVVGDGT